MSRTSGDIEELARFAEQVDRLTVVELIQLCGTWASDDETARHQAWLEVQLLVDETDRSADLQELRDGLVRWAGVPSRSGLMPLSILVSSLREEAAQRRESLPPLLDAGAALLVRDRLSPGSFDTLMHPWSVLQREAAAGAELDEVDESAQSDPARGS